MRRGLLLIIALSLPGLVSAVSIVSDPYTTDMRQPTHCRLIFDSGEPDRVTPVEILPDSSVRCHWAIDDLIQLGRIVPIRVAATAQDQTTGDESETSPFFDLAVSGGLSAPGGLRVEY